MILAIRGGDKRELLTGKEVARSRANVGNVSLPLSRNRHAIRRIRRALARRVPPGDGVPTLVMLSRHDLSLPFRSFS